jgi:hypothetical protein
MRATHASRAYVWRSRLACLPVVGRAAGACGGRLRQIGNPAAAQAPPPTKKRHRRHRRRPLPAAHPCRRWFRRRTRPPRPAAPRRNSQSRPPPAGACPGAARGGTGGRAPGRRARLRGMRGWGRARCWGGVLRGCGPSRHRGDDGACSSVVNKQRVGGRPTCERAVDKHDGQARVVLEEGRGAGAHMWQTEANKVQQRREAAAAATRDQASTPNPCTQPQPHPPQTHVARLVLGAHHQQPRA